MRATLLLLVLMIVPLPAWAADDTAPAAPEVIAVYLIPLDDFPFDYAAHLSRALADDLGLSVKATLPTGALGLFPFPETTQYAAEEIIDTVAEITSRLPERGPGTAFIVLTTRDINLKARQLRFLFASHDKARKISVVSAARMIQTSASPDPPPAQQQIFLRLFKMVKRSIGEQYFGLDRSVDIRDVTYAPIMSLGDIDAMGTEFPQTGK